MGTMQYAQPRGDLGALGLSAGILMRLANVGISTLEQLRATSDGELITRARERGSGFFDRQDLAAIRRELARVDGQNKEGQ